jgi:hypothetical protein
MNFSELMALAGGHAEARIVQTALAVGVFEALARGCQSADAIAAQLQLNGEAVELLLNGLAALTILEKPAEQFALSETARLYLVKSSPRYAGGMILFEEATWQWWSKLPEALRTGLPVRRPDMYQEDPAETEIFINAMDSLVKARGDAEAVANAFDWRNVHALLDVGSGPATYPIALCRRLPRLRATIFDLPGSLEITARYVGEAGLNDRIDLVPGDYRRDPIPGKFDAIFLSNIIHGENTDRNQALIGKLAANVAPAGSILIKDHILDETRAHPRVGAIFSLLMLLTTDGGRCYSFGEIKHWFARAGLTQVRQIDLPPPLTSSLVVGAR